MAETLAVTGLGATMRPVNWEPIHVNRFVFEIEGVDSFLVKAASVLPKVTLGEKEIDWINLKRYVVSSKPKFDAVSLTLYNPINPSGAQQVMEWVRLHWESLTGRMGYSDFYKRDATLKLLDGPGNVISKIEYTGCFITDANFGSTQLDYSGEDILTIELNLRFDNFVLLF